VTGWTRGRAEILGMIERRELTQVTANAELADRLLATARQHVASARLLAASDPYLAYAALHDAIRKALSARCSKFKDCERRPREDTSPSCMRSMRSSAHQWARSCGQLTGSVSPAMRPSIPAQLPTSTRTQSVMTCRTLRLLLKRRPRLCRTCRYSALNRERVPQCG